MKKIIALLLVLNILAVSFFVFQMQEDKREQEYYMDQVSKKEQLHLELSRAQKQQERIIINISDLEFQQQNIMSDSQNVDSLTGEINSVKNQLNNQLTQNQQLLDTKTTLNQKIAAQDAAAKAAAQAAVVRKTRSS